MNCTSPPYPPPPPRFSEVRNAEPSVEKCSGNTADSEANCPCNDSYAECIFCADLYGVWTVLILQGGTELQIYGAPELMTQDFKKNGARLSKVMRPLGAAVLVVNESRLQ